MKNMKSLQFHKLYFYPEFLDQAWELITLDLLVPVYVSNEKEGIDWSRSLAGFGMVGKL